MQILCLVLWFFLLLELLWRPCRLRSLRYSGVNCLNVLFFYFHSVSFIIKYQWNKINKYKKSSCDRLQNTYQRIHFVAIHFQAYDTWIVHHKIQFQQRLFERCQFTRSHHQLKITKKLHTFQLNYPNYNLAYTCNLQSNSVIVGALFFEYSLSNAQLNWSRLTLRQLITLFCTWSGNSKYSWGI